MLLFPVFLVFPVLRFFRFINPADLVVYLSARPQVLSRSSAVGPPAVRSPLPGPPQVVSRPLTILTMHGECGSGFSGFCFPPGSAGPFVPVFLFALPVFLVCFLQFLSRAPSGFFRFGFSGFPIRSGVSGQVCCPDKFRPGFTGPVFTIWFSIIRSGPVLEHHCRQVLMPSRTI